MYYYRIYKKTLIFAGPAIYPWSNRTRQLHHPTDNQLSGPIVRHSHGVKMASRTGSSEAITRTGQSSATADTAAECSQSGKQPS